MKKPVKSVAVGWATIKIPAQPGNAPGRGKSAHSRKPAKKPAPKIAPGWAHAAIQAAQKKGAAAKKAKKAKHHPKRQLALGEGVACCSAEALAASLRLAGWPVGDEDVLELYWRTAPDADAGASVLATLEAAARFGLAGMRPLSVTSVTSVLGAAVGRPALPADGRVVEDDAIPFAHGLILGVGMPASHAVLAAPGGWWSWGELYEPWTDDIEEAWEVTWPAIPSTSQFA